MCGFPFEPDHDILRARLEAGLLIWRVPKKHASKPKEVDTEKAHVESGQYAIALCPSMGIWDQ
ncbi:hypothetical protein Tdes44962_MAKER03478 [Teratosphaeria destructans]|uniref:SHSP domain-containing protein n=1 Tax=Teratosphaeria destructans TaxID=418781 RepID=A0A9W7SPS8_9PEZI|nr:hypothetical protein Tdes44962_MAKER03478 [Teratosphaeria destructans]